MKRGVSKSFLTLRYMPKYKQINLQDMIEEIGEDRTKDILSDFLCDKNMDVQEFLRRKAIEFSKRGFAKTTLVFWVSDNDKEKYLVGYFALSNKNITVKKSNVSKNTYKRIYHFSDDAENDSCTIAAILIGQLGKNYKDGNDTVIDGSELLQMAIDKVKKAQNIIGGKFVYLECENNRKLIEFYERNGFVSFGRRELDKDEDNINGRYLIQMIRYLH